MKRNTKELIIHGAIKNIQRLGIQNVSIRTIASECNITFSNIRYYFPTKEDLLEEVTKTIWDINIHELTDLWEQRSSIQEGLAQIGEYLIVGGIHNRNIVLSAFTPIILEDQTTHFFKKFQTLFNQIQQSSTISHNNLHHYFSSIFFITLCPNVFQKEQFDFYDDSFVKTYINNLLQVIL